MSWLDKNPVGLGLVGACGVLVLTGLLLTFVWSGPGEGRGAEGDADGAMALPVIPQARELGDLGDYEVVINRPVFNETRRPVLINDVESIELVEETEPDIVVSDPPQVRLTGVVITPTERVVTLTPASGGEALVLREGMPLDGEYVGWSVDQVQPRMVRLTSSRGQRLEFELAVHDAMIAKPPEPAPPAEGEVAGEPMPAETAAADPENAGARSRADEIRERIRQRREQLRAEAEQQAEAEGEGQQSRTNAYQNAIQSMIRRGSNNEEQAEDDDSGDN